MAGKKFSIEAIFSAIDKISAPVAKIQKRLGGLGDAASRNLAAFDRRLGSVRGGVQQLAASVVAAGAVGGAAVFAIGKTGAEFEQAITAVGAVSLQSRDQIASLEAEAKRLGATTKFTATEAANAMEVMARAGFTNTEILASVGPVLDTAAASGLEIAEVANHVSNALKGMGLQASQAGRVADVLAVASSKTNSSIGSLGEGLANVASTAREFKIPLEDTVAGIALLQDVGLDASTAGAALNVMLTKMAKPTDDIAAKMRSFGVRFKDAKGNMLPFQQVLANISKAAKKSGGNMDQVAFLADLVGLRGQKAAANLKDLFESGRVGELTKELENASGAAKKMAAIRMNNTIGDWTLFTSAVDGVKVALFETQAGALRGVIQQMTQWVDKNQALIVSDFQAWVQWIGDHLSEIVTWLKRIGVAVAAFYALSIAVKGARLAILAYQAALVITQGATWALGLALNVCRAALLGNWAATVRMQVAQMASTAAQIAGRAATAAVTAATWLYNAALTIGELGMRRFTLSAIAAKIAQMASSVATAAGTAAMWLYNAALVAVDLVTGRLTVSTVAAKVAQLASQAATWLANAAQTAYAVVVGASSGALGLFTAAAWSSVTAIGAQAAALAPFLITVGALTAAVLGLYAAWNQLGKLSKELSGSGGIMGTISKMVEMGTFNPFTAHDAAMNDKARQARLEQDNRERDQAQIIAPHARFAADMAEASASANVSGEITVKPAPGTTATATGKRSKVPLRVQPSGAF